MTFRQPPFPNVARTTALLAGAATAAAMADFPPAATTAASAEPPPPPPLTAHEQELAAGHPRPSYEGVEDIGAMAAALRKHLAGQRRYSFSRGWWKWDRLRARYVDGGRTDANELRILEAAFRALVLHWHDKLKAAGEDDLFYLFFVTTAPGNKVVRQLEGRELVRDLHGGGYHGGWGGAARMRVFRELADRGALTPAEQERVKRIVFQSLDPRFLDFKRGSQVADNHSFGNGGGIALALELYPDAPQAAAARGWLDRIWGSLSGFGDWKEWTYHPYGPIFLHGMLDIAEASGRIEDGAGRGLINRVGRRVLESVHGGGVRGYPNAGIRVRADQAAVHADPWNVGYYDIEQSPRDAHFWYRVAQHHRDPEFLWAAEQSALGGRPPFDEPGEVYMAAYERRFGWFRKEGIAPFRRGRGGAAISYLSPGVHRIPERLHLRVPGREVGAPVASFFLYDKKAAHLDNVSGHLFEYSVGGAKLLHTSGKYNNVYGGGDTLRGGGTGEESLDLLLVMQRKHPFPLHPDRKGDGRDFMRRGSIEHRPELAAAENNPAGDAFGQFGFDHYYGAGSRWVRRAVLTVEGYLVVGDTYTAGPALGDDFQAGPVWHLGMAPGEGPAAEGGPQERNWFHGPALDRAWWQTGDVGVVLLFHDDGRLKFGSIRQSHSQDVAPNITTFAHRPISRSKTERFLSVLRPAWDGARAEHLAAQVTTEITGDGTFRAAVAGGLSIEFREGGGWSVTRPRRAR